MEAESPENLVSVAQFHQKVLQWFAFMWLGSIPGNILILVSERIELSIVSNLIYGLVLVVFLLIYLCMTYFVYHLADALRYERPMYWVIGMLILSPMFVFILLYLNYKAVSALRENNVNVGLMGVSGSHIQRLLREKKNNKS